MHNENSPIAQAILRIEDALRRSAHYQRTTQTLAWIALARLQSIGRLGSIEQIVKDGLWDQVTSAGISRETTAYMKELSSSTLAALEAAIRLCSDLKGAPDTAWDVLPHLISPERRQFIIPEILVSQPVVNLMVDMLGQDKGSVWAPFDPSGQFAITAARKGFSVYTAPIRDIHSQIKHLLMLLESEETKARFIDEIPRNETGLPEIKVDYILADPPLGVSIKPDEWAQWERPKANKYQRFDRAETWAIYELLARTNRRLVILTSQQWLFSTGQERQLREQLLRSSSNIIESITTFPGGIFSSSNIQAAITSFDHLRAERTIRVTSLEMASRQGSIEELIMANKERVLRDSDETKYSKVVPVQSALDAECVLLPQRLLRRAILSGKNAVSLDEICTVLRPPTPYKGNGESVLELGIPNLRDGRWNAIRYEERSDRFRSANVKPGNRTISYLTKDDLLLSIKGTLGLAGLLSDFYGKGEDQDSEAEWVKAVVSGSCIALRLNPGAAGLGISPKYLLMYLRSPEGQEQIRSLAVGAAVPHINVQSLVSMLRVPVPTAEELSAVHQDYKKLCEIEEKIEYLRHQMDELIENRWPVKLA
jgi:hypothetical protein